MDANLAKLAKKLMKGPQTLEELRATKTEIRELLDAGYPVQGQGAGKNRQFYILTGKEHLSHFLSGRSKEPVVARWVELSDFHVGCKQFQEEMLRECLQRAVDEGYKEAFISGDVCDGINVYRGHWKNVRYHSCEEQASYTAEILADYPLAYFAITGNHDSSFEKQGSPNPLRLIEAQIGSKNSDSDASFVFLDSQAADLIIRGTCYRMVHLRCGTAYATSYPGQVYLRNLAGSHDLNVHIRGNKYRIRFAQLGHLHTNVVFENNGIHVTHPGNFQGPNDFCVAKGLVGDQGCRFTECVIMDGKVFEYRSAFIKPYTIQPYAKYKGGRLLKMCAGKEQPDSVIQKPSSPKKADKKPKKKPSNKPDEATSIRALAEKVLGEDWQEQLDAS